jgi:hypothetical protein
MVWFDRFYKNFAEQFKNLVIDKEIIFRGFTRLIMAEYDPVLEDLKSYIKDNGLLDDQQPI